MIATFSQPTFDAIKTFADSDKFVGMYFERLKQFDELSMHKIAQLGNQHLIAQLAKFVIGHMMR